MTEEQIARIILSQYPELSKVVEEFLERVRATTRLNPNPTFVTVSLGLTRCPYQGTKSKSGPCSKPSVYGGEGCSKHASMLAKQRGGGGFGPDVGFSNPGGMNFMQQGGFGGQQPQNQFGGQGFGGQQPQNQFGGPAPGQALKPVANWNIASNIFIDMQTRFLIHGEGDKAVIVGIASIENNKPRALTESEKNEAKSKRYVVADYNSAIESIPPTDLPAVQSSALPSGAGSFGVTPSNGYPFGQNPPPAIVSAPFGAPQQQNASPFGAPQQQNASPFGAPQPQQQNASPFGATPSQESQSSSSSTPESQEAASISNPVQMSSLPAVFEQGTSLENSTFH